MGRVGGTVGLVVGLAAVGVGAAAAYVRFGREPCLHWGARPDEADGPMACDQLLTDPDILSTRAITIDAPPGAIWPWLVQFGPHRGGAYTYDWIENLFGLDMHSADEILPEFQDIAIGDAHQLGTNGPRLRVAELDPERALVFASDDGHWVWSFELRPEPHGTRLLSRNRIAAPEAALPVRLMNTVVMEPGSLIMERKMLLGLKERGERTAAERRSVKGSDPHTVSIPHDHEESRT